jgi:predicted RNA-binding protein (virulence factor B family)
MLKPGFYYELTILEKTADGYWFGETKEQMAFMPKQYADSGLLVGDKLSVFLYHDSTNVLCATNKKPKGKVGDLVTLKVVDMSPAGAFLDWGLPKDLLLPRSMHEDDLLTGDYCLVKILYDAPTGKVIAKEKLSDELNNEVLTVREKEIVQCIVYKDTELGYQVIVNEKHLGLLHYNEVFKDLFVGDVFTGFVKKIKEENKLDIMIGKPGYQRVEDEGDVILRELRKHNGYLPYHDKSSTEDIYRVFGMSKKTFKMTLGNLYRDRKIKIEPEGIRLA